MILVSEIDRLKREARVIKQAPASFFIVCLIAMGLMWGAFHFVYKDKLDNAHEDTSHWKSSSDYWKDRAEHPKPVDQPVCPKLDCPEAASKTGHPSKTSSANPPIKQSVIDMEGGQVGQISQSGTTTMTADGTTTKNQSGVQIGAGANISSLSAKDVDICFGNDWGCFVKTARNAAQQRDISAFEERVKDINRKTEVHLTGHSENAEECRREVAAGIELLRSNMEDETTAVNRLLDVKNMPICFRPQ